MKVYCPSGSRKIKNNRSVCVNGYHNYVTFPFELKELQDLESAFIFLYSNYKYALYAPTTAKLLAYHAHDAVITSSDVQCTRQH